MLMFDGEKWNEYHLVDILHVPRLKYNLFSVGAALDKDLEMKSIRNTCELSGQAYQGKRSPSRKTLLNAIRGRQSSKTKTGTRTNTNEYSISSTLRNWHEKLVHQNFRHVRQILDRFQKNLSKPRKTLSARHARLERCIDSHSRIASHVRMPLMN